jgi:hypothetical protein
MIRQLADTIGLILRQAQDSNAAGLTKKINTKKSRSIALK